MSLEEVSGHPVDKRQHTCLAAAGLTAEQDDLALLELKADVVENPGGGSIMFV